MATKIKGKGSQFKLSISATLTEIASVISIDGPDAEAETFESDALDNGSAGIPYQPTGRSEGGSVSGELFLDPVESTHQAITDLLITPAVTAGEIQFADAATTKWSLSIAGFSFGVAIALSDGVKASFSAKLSGIAGYTT